MKKVSMSKICVNSQYGYDFRLPGSDLFICRSGLKKHWDVDTARKLEIRLHNGKPSRDAHRFCVGGSNNETITILPEKGEDWSSSGYGTYSLFSDMMNDFVVASGSKVGWMEVSILE